MSRIVASPALEGKRKMLSASFAPPAEHGKTFSDDEIGRMFGRVIERALQIADKTPQELAFAADYANQTPVSKLIHPVEPTPMARLLAVKWFKAAYILALAEDCEGVRVQTLVTLDRAVNS